MSSLIIKTKLLVSNYGITRYATPELVSGTHVLDDGRYAGAELVSKRIWGAGGQNAASQRVLGGYAPLCSKIVMYVCKSIFHELFGLFSF